MIIVYKKLVNRDFSREKYPEVIIMNYSWVFFLFYPGIKTYQIKILNNIPKIKLVYPTTNKIFATLCLKELCCAFLTNSPNTKKARQLKLYAVLLFFKAIDLLSLNQFSQQLISHECLLDIILLLEFQLRPRLLLDFYV